MCIEMIETKTISLLVTYRAREIGRHTSNRRHRRTRQYYFVVFKFPSIASCYTSTRVSRRAFIHLFFSKLYLTSHTVSAIQRLIIANRDKSQFSRSHVQLSKRAAVRRGKTRLKLKTETFVTHVQRNTFRFSQRVS